MFRIGSTLGLTGCFGKDAYKKMKEAGFYGVDYPIGYELNGRTVEEYEAEIMKEVDLMKEAGVVLHQVHGPFRYPIHDETEEIRAERADVMKKSIRLAARLGCKTWVIHPMMPFGEDRIWPEEVWRINEEFFRGHLIPCAVENGVTICLENMPMSRHPLSKPDDILKFVRQINDENFKFCLDTGHCSVFGIQPGEIVRRAGDLLRAMHVHDNNGRNDQHLLPYMGVIDWKDYVAALREIGYEGVFSFETSYRDFLPNATNEVRFECAKAIIRNMLDESK